MKALLRVAAAIVLLAGAAIAGAEPAIATAETVYVLVDAHALTKKAVDGDFRSALERGIDILTDQSGAAAART